MREIKFRQWRENTFARYMDYEPTFFVGTGLSVFINEAIKESESPLMQYTGLQDKHGKEIYEGDVVEFNNNDYERTAGNLNDEIKVAEVEYSCGAWGLKEANGQLYDLYIVLVNDEEAEVIGNIYENPELLEAD